MKATARAVPLIARTAFVLLWLAAAWLLLECGAALWMWWTFNHNAYILADRGLAPKPSPFFVAAEIPEADLGGLSWPSEVPALPVAWEGLKPEESETEGNARRQLFLQLDENDREYFARLHSEVVCRFSPGGAVTSRYGVWTRESPDTLVTLIRGARQQDHTHHGTTIIPGWDVPLPVFFLRDESDGSLYAFTNVEEAILQFDTKGLSGDSPWVVPFYQYKPNLAEVRADERLPGFPTNNLGLRGPDITMPKPPGVFRILCVGGSTTLEGAEEATYPKLLDKALQEAFPGRPIEVINGGVPGMTTTRHLLKFPQYLEMQPDLLVVYEGVNDIWHDLVVVWHSRKSPLAALLTHSPFLRLAWNRLLFPSDDVIAGDLEALTVANLRTLVRGAKAHGIPTIICGIAHPDLAAISHQQRAYFDYAARADQASRYLSAEVYCDTAVQLCGMLKAFCAREQIPYVPVEEAVSGGVEAFEDICHMTQPAIERKAAIIAAYTTEYIAPTIQPTP